MKVLPGKFSPRRQGHGDHHRAKNLAAAIGTAGGPGGGCDARLSVGFASGEVVACAPGTGDRPRVFEAAEYYGHAVGTLLIIVTVGVLDPAKKRLLPWLLAASLGAGLTADVAKQLIERQRPRELDLANVEITTTITSVLPFLEGKVASHSFPSGHTATAFGLTVALSTLYRRGETWFVILACLVGVQRVQSLSHFPSDVLAGAAIGLLVGWLIADSKLKVAY